ncbi:hypothetical protein AX16_006844 [Volvariella volvacea WC 439]|nr:hypothetical protein AX16_006844 [Volvariella volvacea WC 439]
MAMPDLTATPPVCATTGPADDDTPATRARPPEETCVLVQSSDGAVFKVHKLLISLHRQGLTPSDCPTTPDGVFVLSEPSSVLKRVLYYLYPLGWEDPLPIELSVEEVVNTARAMDKYRVTLAQKLWLQRVKDSAARSPVPVLAYAAQSHNRTVGDTVKYAVARPRTLWTDWFSYYERWNTAVRTAVDAIPTHDNQGSSECDNCGSFHCSSTPALTLIRLAVSRMLASSGNFANLKAIDDYPEQLERGVCKTCSQSSIRSELQEWRNKLQQSIEIIPCPLALNFKAQKPRLLSHHHIGYRICLEFQLHKKNLEVCCAVFPPSTHPTVDWEALEFSKLRDLSEAVEKYQAHTAMYLCKVLMKRFIQSHPAALFAYSTKHGYNDLADEVALLMLKLGIEVKDLVSLLRPDVVLAWARYLEHVWSLCNKAISTFPSIRPEPKTSASPTTSTSKEL